MTKAAQRAQATSPSLLFLHDLEPPLGDFRADILSGLRATPKTTSPKYFYDERGSALFDQITSLPEYYPTRTEIALLEQSAPEIADWAGPRAGLIELGSGSSVKVRILLDALRDPALYVAQDISRDHLIDAAQAVALDYPNVDVGAICSDFTQTIETPDAMFANACKRIAFFPGSTIGNFEPDEAKAIWRSTRALLRAGDGFVVGVDLVKDIDVLIAAYDDAAGVTAEFNLNLLHRINGELAGDIVIDNFAHKIIWNEVAQRIEMHLESLVDQVFTVTGEAFTMAQGETIHTENSHKFKPEWIIADASTYGFALERQWIDEQCPFGVFLFKAV